VAVVNTSPHLDAAVAFKNFQYTAAAQKVWAQAGFRPVDPAVAADFRNQYPVPAKLWTIGDLGGWATADPQLFDKTTGSITEIYAKATG
jgi:sulfate transport system substrate-binding protein